MTEHHASPAQNRDAVAADWVLRLAEREVSEQTLSEWLTWCEADPRNRKAFEAMETVWRVSGDVDAVEFAGSADAAASAVVNGAPSTAVVRLLAVASNRHPRHRRIAAVAIAASVLALACLPLVWRLAPWSDALPLVDAQANLQTERGHVRSVQLADGTRVDLGGESALSVRYTSDTRLVVADAGEAYFNVHKDRTRPFVVQAGPLTVTAVGTAFSIQRERDSVTVTVTEGVVEARAARLGPTPVRLAAGQRARLDRGEWVQSVEPVDTRAAAAWRQGRLEFRDEPLRLAVARINRYGDRRIVIEDPAIQDLRVTGTAYTDRIDAWLDGVQVVLPIRVDTANGERVVLVPLSREPTPPLE